LIAIIKELDEHCDVELGRTTLTK